MNAGRLSNLVHQRNFYQPQHPYTQTLLRNRWYAGLMNAVLDWKHDPGWLL